MIVPSLIAVAGPIVTGLLFGAGAVFGLLAGGLAAGFAMAVMMANAGGAWDNAKKWVEKGGLAEKFIEEGIYNPAIEDAALAPVKGDQGGPDGKKGGKKGKKGKTSARSKPAAAEEKPEPAEEEKPEAAAEAAPEAAPEETAAEPAPESTAAETPAVSPTAQAPEAPAPVAAQAETPSEPPLVVSTTAPAPSAAAESAPKKKKYLKYMKGSPEHKATVVGDTVGDPFKDTSGPSLNILIKLMSMVAVATVALIMVVNDGNGILPWLFELLFTSK
jgi:hypothetical protein